MLFKNDEAKENWETLVSKNKDFYGSGIIDFSVRWADLMEKELEDGVSIKESMQRTENKADTDGITGYMYGVSVNILSKCWKYGDELRVLHNKSYGFEGDGTVNPAIITVSSKNQE